MTLFREWLGEDIAQQLIAETRKIIEVKRKRKEEEHGAINTLSDNRDDSKHRDAASGAVDNRTSVEAQAVVLRYHEYFDRNGKWKKKTENNP